MVRNKIVPYFEKKDITVASLRAKDIHMFYANELKTVSPNTVIHEHANNHRALKYTVKMDLIDFNPADKVDRPKKQKFIAEHYSLEELAALFEATKTHYLGLLIQVTAFYGLKHSCASLLLANGVSLKEIQEWLGHSDIATTADIYSQLILNQKSRQLI